MSEELDMVNNPPHYQGCTLKLECFDFAKGMTFAQGSAFKYVWRAGLKGDEAEDLRKALWYLNRAEKGASLPDYFCELLTRSEEILARKIKCLKHIIKCDFASARGLVSEWLEELTCQE